MPELPEVETIVRAVRPYAEGKKIRAINSNTPRLFRDCGSLSAVKKEVLGKRITALDRIGKNIIFRLEGTRDLWLHLMMSGSLIVAKGENNDPYIRMELKLHDGTALLFRDIRKFGRVRLVQKGENLKLGPDALLISFREFARVLQRKKKAVKTLLLDQSLMSGIGNIYADEILWHAGVHPLRAQAELSGGDIKEVYVSMRKILARAIRAQGTSFRDYRKPDGTKGGYFAMRKVYQREGEACARDGALIKRIIVAQRSTHFCPMHQK